MKEAKGVHIERMSLLELVITLVLAAVLAYVMMTGNREFQALQYATDQYIQCENAAKQLQDGSDYLTEQVRLYAMTQQTYYRNLYFKEANETQRREKALEALRDYFEGTETFTALEKALSASEELMDTEYYSMRLVASVSGTDPAAWPEELRVVELTPEDEALSRDKKLAKAQALVCDDNYQKVREEITEDVSGCMTNLIAQTRGQQARASSAFTRMYRCMEIGITVLVVLMLLSALMARKLIVKPLLRFDDSIREEKPFPVLGAAELRYLALTYNEVFEQNQEAQKLIRHEAEHDGLTDLLNRSSFDRLQQVYADGDRPYALILVDVDVFKSVNDTYGHAMGDQILKKVAGLLQNAFRSIDYICRIGGDEFAVIMVEMTSDLAYTIVEKIDYVNKELSEPADGLPAVSLSVGVAFTDRKDPTDSIFKDADRALYDVKEHGKHGCGFYGGEGCMERPDSARKQ